MAGPRVHAHDPSCDPVRGVALCAAETRRGSTLHDGASNRPVEDRGKLLGNTAAVAGFLNRLLHHVLTCGPRSWRICLQGERSDA